MVSPRVVLIAVALATVATASRSYDAACDDIVAHARKASAAHNAGNAQLAQEESDLAEAAYRTALKAAPKNRMGPVQAHLSMATFLLNSQRLEKAAALFASVEEMLPHDDLRTRGMVAAQARRARYGLLSQQRDRAYDGGRGDVRLAQGIAVQQLELAPEPYRVAHEVATLEATLCEQDRAMCGKAQDHFMQAQRLTMEAYTARRLPPTADPMVKKLCQHSAAHVGHWHTYRPATPTTVVPGLQVVQLSQGLRLTGPDAVVVVDGEPEDCTVLSPASDRYLDLAENILPRRAARASMTIKAGVVVPLVGYATQSFYHWLCESVPKLATLLEASRQRQDGLVRIGRPSDYGAEGPDSDADDETILLIPKLRASTAFVSKSLTLLERGIPVLGQLREAGRLRYVEYKPQVALTEDASLFAATWEQQRCPGSGDRACHALAHPHALRLGAAALVRGLEAGPFAPVFTVSRQQLPPLIVVAARGPGVRMRRADEDEIVAGIRGLISRHAVRLPGPGTFTTAARIEVAGPDTPLEETLSLFRAARVVVGVHGGALSNAMACMPGTLLLEAGFEADGTQHYAHLADALQLKYQRVRVGLDPKHRAFVAPDVVVPVPELVAAIEGHLFPDGPPDSPEAAAQAAAQADL